MGDSPKFITDRRKVVAGLTALGVGATAGWPLRAAAASSPIPLGAATPYDFAKLVDHAKTLAAAPYVAPTKPDEAAVKTLDFARYQTISFKPEMTLWAQKGSPFSVRLFHLGEYFPTPVAMHLVETGNARPVEYAPDAFAYKDPSIAKALSPNLGYAGFRFMEPDGPGDWLAFLGASYFRAAGPEKQYGLSARGLSIDTGLAGEEEFPRFSAFWLHRPAPGADHIVVDALLESPSCTGAYRFVISKPDRVVMDVTSHIFARKDIAQLGVAPLTSMYWYSKTNRRISSDWRPAVHDSDGLAIWNGAGERLWRPLNDPTIPRMSEFLDDSPHGFGLLQRDRTFADYQDDSNFYNKRPAVWVEPKQGWGKGAVQLIELPTNNENQDNIGVFWKPAGSIKAGDALSYKYRLYWVAEEPFPPARAHVIATRQGRGGVAGQVAPPHTEKFVIDFEGGPFQTMKRRYDVMANVTASRGTVKDAYVIQVLGTHVWRAFFDLDVTGNDPVELRCSLSLDGKQLTETWVFQYDRKAFLPSSFQTDIPGKGVGAKRASL